MRGDFLHNRMMAFSYISRIIIIAVTRFIVYEINSSIDTNLFVDVKKNELFFESAPEHPE